MSKRSRISDMQREILEGFYRRGMVGTGSLYKEMVEKAASDTELTKTQVEKWIGNQKRKRPQESTAEEDVTLKRIKAVRGPHAYNLFCAEFFKTDDCKGLSHEEKNKLASEKWKGQTDEQKSKFVDCAKAHKQLNTRVSELTEKQKQKLIDRHRKKLLEEIMALEDLGCQISTLYLDISGEVYNLGSKAGTTFLAANQDISIKFREFFGNNNQHFTITDVQDLFNKKYSQACGKQCKVPYLRGGFEVHGLPEGITFKKPYNYGRHQLKQIMLAADSIYFMIVSTNEPEDQPEENPSDAVSAADDNVQALLSKIGGTEAANRALDGGQIMEEEVEVVDLNLSPAERLTLYALCLQFFSPDAWLSVGANIKHSDEAKSLLLPIYTTAKEQFWLFQTVSKPTRIMKSVTTTKIRGHWLDLRADGSYCVLPNGDQVTGKNIIRTAHGPLYFECNLSLESEEPYHLPTAIRSVILTTLHKAGLSTSPGLET